MKTDYGSWDSDFTMESLDAFIGEYYKKLKKGGTLIMFFDLWKITNLKEILEKFIGVYERMRAEVATQILSTQDDMTKKNLESKFFY